MTRTTAAIVAIFRTLGCTLPEGEYTILRTRAGRCQRAGGAWSWMLSSPNPLLAAYAATLGSQWPAHEVIHAHCERRVTLHYDDFIGDGSLIVEEFPLVVVVDARGTCGKE